MHCKSFLILIFYRSQSLFFLKCWPIGDPFCRLGSLFTPPTSSTLNVVPLVLVLFDTVPRSTAQTVFYTYLHLLSFIPCLQIDFAKVCTGATGRDRFSFFFRPGWVLFNLQICRILLLRLSHIFVLYFQ